MNSYDEKGRMLFRMSKSDSVRDAKCWQKLYEERKRLAMAAFKS